MKTLNLIAALFTAALLTISFNSNSFSYEIKTRECCDAQFAADNCCNSEGCGSAQASAGCCLDNCSNDQCKECCSSGNCAMNKSGGNSKVKKESTAEVLNSCAMNKTSEEKAADCCSK